MVHKIVGPTDVQCDAFMLNGVPFPIVADLTEGGYLSIIVGENPIGIPVPGIAVPKGGMLALIVPELAEKIRGGLKQAAVAALKGNALRP
jgi:hypothetical protein